MDVHQLPDGEPRQKRKQIAALTEDGKQPENRRPFPVPVTASDEFTVYFPNLKWMQTKHLLSI